MFQIRKTWKAFQPGKTNVVQRKRLQVDIFISKSFNCGRLDVIQVEFGDLSSKKQNCMRRKKANNSSGKEREYQHAWR